MAVDFDFNTTYNDDEENDNESNEALEEEEEIEEAEEPKKSSPLRTILLILIVLLLLCVGCWGISRFVPLPIPGLGAVTPATATPAEVGEPPAGEQPAAGEEGAPTGEGEAPAAGEVTEGEGEQPSATDEAEAPAGEGEAEDEAVAGEGEAEDEAVAGEGEEAAPGEGEAAPGAVEGEPGEEPAAEGGAEQPSATAEAAPGEEGAAEDEIAAGEGEPGAAEGEPGAEEEPSIIITVTPVAGPTPTPGPGEPAAPAQVSCDNNTAPTADAGGPYNAMMGKGQAIITFDGTNSTDSDGTIDSYEWDFGDGSTPGSGATARYVYTQTGSYQVTLTVTDNCGAISQDTAGAIVVGPTPPAENGDGDSGGDGMDDTGTDDTGQEGSTAPAPAPAPPVGPSTGTLGFCYRVSWGDTLWGIAWYYDVPVDDLAYVNGVTPKYFVIAGEGLFVPTEEPTSGPNVYQVQSGDTLHSIAYVCGISATDLALANNMSPDASLTPGQYVTVPLPWR